MPQFHYVVISERSYDSSTGQGVTASVERPVEAGHLQDTAGLSNEMWGKTKTTNVSSYSFHLTLGEEKL